MAELSMTAEQAFYELDEVFKEVQSLIDEQEYRQACIAIDTLQQRLARLFTLDSFNKNIFLENNTKSIEQRELLLAIDNFLAQHVEKLTHTSKDLKTELSAMTVAKKMKKAYGKL